MKVVLRWTAMGLFKKKIKFISAICPECKGNLQLDSNLTNAYCQYCGAQCIVENAPKKQEKKGTLETLIDFFERQQALRRQEKHEREKKIEENDKKTKAHFAKFWWVYVLVGVLFYGLLFVMAVLERQGII